MSITDARKEKLTKVAKKRQLDLSILLENVHDPHNISAVLRSCETVGITQVYVLYTEDHLDAERLKMGKHSSAGARKWVDVHYFDKMKPCIQHLRSKYHRILGAYMNPEAQSLYSLDLCKSTVLAFGNERDGISNELLEHLDGQFFIPQMGLIQSLNISVACAVSVYEALRQRSANGMYREKVNPSHNALAQEYIRRHLDKYEGEEIITHDSE